VKTGHECYFSEARNLKGKLFTGLAKAREQFRQSITSDLIPPSHSRARRPCHDSLVAWPSRPWYKTWPICELCVHQVDL